MERDDADLIKQYKMGDGDAFTELFHRYKNKIYNFIYHFVNNPDTADDLVLVTFMKAIKNIKRYREEGKFRGWLYSIANSVTMDYLRKRKRQPVEPIEDWMEITDSSPSPEKSMEQKEMLILYEDKINSLPPKQKQVFMMRQEGDLRFKEIAEILNCPLPTVLSRMHNAVVSLRKSLRGCGYEV